MQRIAIFTGPKQRQVVNLNGWRGVLVYTWNTLGEYWTLDIRTSEDELIIGTLKLIPGVPLLQQYGVYAIPGGNIVLLDTEGTNALPTLDNLSTRYALIFATREEINAAV
jgi:hypothetical protein